MRKMLSVTLAALFLLGMLAGCGGGSSSPSPSPTPTVTTAPPTEVTSPTEPATPSPTPSPTVAASPVPTAVVTAAIPDSKLAMINKKKPPITMPDLTSDMPYYEAANLMITYGLVSGNDDGAGGRTFTGEDPVIRWQAVALASRVHSYFVGDNEAFAKADPADSDYQPYLDYAAKNNIVSDFDDPEAPATVAELAAIYNGALPAEMLPTINNINSVPNMQPGDQYYDAVLNLLRAGVLDIKNLDPSATALRSDAAALVLARLVIPSRRLTQSES